MSNDKFRFIVRDANERELGPLSGFANATLIPRWNDIGTWSLKIPVRSQGAEMLKAGTGLVVYLNNKIIISGPIDQIGYTDNIQDQALTPAWYDVSGFSDMDYLNAKLALPNPYAAGSSQNANANDIISDNAENVIYHYVAANMRDAHVSRKVANFFVNDGLSQGRGGIVSGSARFDNLFTLVSGFAKTTRLTMEVNWSPGKLTFNIEQPRDLTNRAIFSQGRNNLGNVAYQVNAPTSTYCIVAGSGVGTARNIFAYTEPSGAEVARWGRTWETFVDRRDSDDTADYDQAAVENFQNDGETYSLSAALIDTPQLQFGRDYGLGDIVSVEVDDTIIQDVVTQVTYSLDDNSIVKSVVPVVGDWSTDGNLVVEKAVQRLIKDVHNLKGRY